VITPGDIQRAQYCIQESGIIGILQNGMTRSNRGRKPNLTKLELVFVGMLLSLKERGTATITSAHRILTEDLPFNEQLRLGVISGTPEKSRKLSLSDCYYQVEIISNRLDYGHGTRLTVTQDERDRRRRVILDVNNALMDAVASATPINDSTVAIDGSGWWAWAKHGGYDPPSVEEVERIGDPVVRDKLLEGIRKGELTGDGPDAATIRLMKQSVDKSTTSVDQDAGWGGKTSKSGDPEPFFGFMAHTLVNVPDAKIDDDPSTQAVVVRRFEVTRAADDVVGPTFALIDSLPAMPNHILVDRLYNHKQYARWQKPLIERGIRQHFDLRSDDHGAVYVDGVPFIDGCGHCPAMPKGMDVIQRHGIFASREERDAFHTAIAEREQYALVTRNQQTPEGKIKYECPAVAGKVGCPLRAGSVDAAAAAGKPIIAEPPNERRDGIPLPRICSTKTSAWYTMPEAVAKNNQSTYWGSRTWLATYQPRTYVEGVFGNAKNSSAENLGRGTTQVMGLVWANIAMGMVFTAFGIRSLRNRQARNPDEIRDHVLLAHDPGPLPWGILTQEQIDREWEIHIDQVVLTLEDLGEPVDRTEEVASTELELPKRAESRDLRRMPIEVPSGAN